MRDGSPVISNNCIVMILAMVADSDRLDRLLSLFHLLVEGSHWLTRVGIYFKRASINFWEGLNFNIITPDFILPFSLTVSFNAAIDVSIHKVLEVVLTSEDVVDALFSYKILHLLIAIDLKCDCTEETISVTIHLFNSKLSIVV